MSRRLAGREWWPQSAPATAEPVVDPGAKNAVKERLAARKKNLAGDDG